MKIRKSLFVLGFLQCCVCLIGLGWAHGSDAGEHNKLKEWLHRMSDMKYICKEKNSAGDKNFVELDAVKELFELADCNDKGARYDYSIQVRKLFPMAHITSKLMSDK